MFTHIKICLICENCANNDETKYCFYIKIIVCVFFYKYLTGSKVAPNGKVPSSATPTSPMRNSRSGGSCIQAKEVQSRSTKLNRAQTLTGSFTVGEPSLDLNTFNRPRDVI